MITTESGKGMGTIREGATAACVVLAIVAATPAWGATCAERPVSVRGEPSSFEVLAKAKARGNWRARVRALPALGALYANWNKALAGEYRCNQKDGRYVCVAVGYPCRD